MGNACICKKKNKNELQNETNNKKSKKTSQKGIAILILFNIKDTTQIFYKVFHMIILK